MPLHNFPKDAKSFPPNLKSNNRHNFEVVLENGVFKEICVMVVVLHESEGIQV